jgi:membrane protease YdiL (CAAX protease family)
VDLFFEVLATVVMVVLVVVLPVLGYRGYARLQADVTRDPGARMRMYRRSTVRKWCLVPPILVIAWWRGDEATVSIDVPYAWVLVVVLLAALAAGSVLVVLRSRDAESARELTDAADSFAAILPRTPEERRMFVLVAITAGVTEELAYRAFMIGYLHWLAPGLGPYWLLLLSSAIFGSGHAYQGVRGVVTTGVLGLVLGFVYLTTGLLAAVVIHSVVDLRALLIPLGPTQPAAEPEATGS